MSKFSKEDQRSYMKIESTRGKSATEVHTALEEACGQEALSYPTVAEWMKRFKAGRVSVTDDPREGRPVFVTTDENVEKVKDLLDEDKRFTCEEIAERIGIGHNSVHHILTAILGKRKIVARWVPHHLSDDQKTCRMTISAQHLARFRREGDLFLKRIVAIDESWMRDYEPELKSQSSEWKGPDSPRPIKFRRQQSKVKQLRIFAYDWKGVLTAHTVPIGQTVNKEYYKAFLRNTLRPAIRKKRPELIEMKPLILHDNASCHKTQVVIDVLENWEWEILAHPPPYSPDLSPPDFDLFPVLKLPLRGHRFATLQDLNDAVDKRVKEINKEGLCQGILKLPDRWQCVIEKQGDYFERQ